jgi:hypothetical protein
VMAQHDQYDLEKHEMTIHVRPPVVEETKVNPSSNG